MRVLMFNRSTIHTMPGGDVVQMLKTRTALELNGIEVDIATPDDMPTRYDYAVVHLFNIQVYEDSIFGLEWALKHNIPTVLSPIFWDLNAFYAYKAIHSDTKWKTVKAILGELNTFALYQHWQKIKRKFPLMTHSRTGLNLQKRLLLECKIILPNASSEASLIQDYFALPTEWHQKVHLVPNGIDRKLFTDINPDTDIIQKYGLNKCILQVGWIGESKNQLGLIRGLVDFPGKIVLIGQPSPQESKYYLACQEEASKRGNVVFIGHLPHEELPPIYQAAGVHVLPSWRETPGLASLEAAAAGCKVVSTSIGSAKEYFGEAAWYCHPMNLLSIKKAVSQASSAPTSENLRKTIIDRFTWDRAASESLNGYQMALDRV